MYGKIGAEITGPGYLRYDNQWQKEQGSDGYVLDEKDRATTTPLDW